MTAADTWWTIVTIYLAVGFMAWFWTFLFLDDHPQQKGWGVAAVLWPISLIILSPVLLVKLVAVTFKRRGLLSSWLFTVTDTYKKAVK